MPTVSRSSFLVLSAGSTLYLTLGQQQSSLVTDLTLRSTKSQRTGPTNYEG